MQRVFVLDQHRQPLMPCHPAWARHLLRQGKAAVYRRAPFTIILKERKGGETQPVELRVDPGSKITGLAVVAHFQRGLVLLWAANLAHRGQTIKASLDRRRAVRHSRRQRKTRYRAPRFLNRRRAEGWLPPSLRSRVDNVTSWTSRLAKLCPLNQIAVETVRFDTHKLINPEVSGVEYQQGTLWGYEIRGYLLEKWGRRCAYCDAQGLPLQVEHIVPRARGGTDRVSNLTLSCEACNVAKRNQDVREFLAHDPVRLARLLAQARTPLKDAAAVNATRYAIGQALKGLGIGPVSFWSGGRTQFNRLGSGYDKDHWLDAACVGEQAARVPAGLRPLLIRATGRGSRQMCRMDRYGFPRTSAKQLKRVRGFQTGDLVRAVVPSGKKAGGHLGRVAVRSKGSFRVGQVDGVNWRYCCLVQRADGYEYLASLKRPAIPHHL
ncbi:MAG: hypothetical protein BroJett011_42050 [Chloroflexota bacterium]|nr:MAG: hypothetical protein BroJett011_42050 [Chloroflexota bacterium]